MSDTTNFNEMSEEEFSALSSTDKVRLAGAWHQSIIHASREAVAKVVSTGLDEIDKYNAMAEAQGKPLRHPNSLMVLITHVDDPMLPDELRSKWDEQNLEYGVLSVDRHVWTGGPGAPAWERKHPYKKLMKSVAKDPPDGQIFIVVFAGGVCTVGKLGRDETDVPETSQTTGDTTSDDEETETDEAIVQ